MRVRCSLPQVYGRSDKGYMPNALIIFNKYEYERITIARPDSLGDVDVITYRWQYGLFIDLWLVKLKFEWKMKSKEGRKIKLEKPF